MKLVNLVTIENVDGNNQFVWDASTGQPVECAIINFLNEVNIYNGWSFNHEDKIFNRSIDLIASWNIKKICSR